MHQWIKNTFTFKIIYGRTGHLMWTCLFSNWEPQSWCMHTLFCHLLENRNRTKEWCSVNRTSLLKRCTYIYTNKYTHANIVSPSFCNDLQHIWICRNNKKTSPYSKYQNTNIQLIYTSFALCITFTTLFKKKIGAKYTKLMLIFFRNLFD